MPNKRVLFLCTGNYYRSRFAEELFNHIAHRDGLSWHATSRGLAIERGINNVGPIAQSTVEALLAHGISPADVLRMPMQCTAADLEVSDIVVAVKEAEHRQLLADRFPGWEDRTRYWHVHDLDAAPPDVALAVLKICVEDFIQKLTLQQGGVVN